MFKQIENKILN